MTNSADGPLTARPEFRLLSDALPNINFIMSMSLGAELPQPVADRYNYRAMATHSAKPIVYTA